MWLYVKKNNFPLTREFCFFFLFPFARFFLTGKTFFQQGSRRVRKAREDQNSNTTTKKTQIKKHILVPFFSGAHCILPSAAKKNS